MRGAVGLVLAAVLAVAGALPAQADAAADDVAARVGAERAAVGAPPLVRDAALDAAATEWARHLGTSRTFAHSTNDWRVARARPGWTLCCGENIAAGQTTSSAVMSAWMGSAGHRANILDPRYTHVGVGHVTVTGSPYGHYWVQIFATYPPVRAQDEAFVRALYVDFLGRQAGPAEVNHWTASMAQGAGRYEVASALARSDEWLAAVITRFYRDTLAREPDAAGLAGWVAAAKGGMPVAQIASAFYASPEYFATTGRGSNEVWLRDLYRKLLLREADAGGLSHWLQRLAAGTPRAQVALAFYQSTETARVRVDRLYRDLLGRPAEPAGLAHWAPIVLARGDLALAASLASSQEYYVNASR